MPRLAQKVHKIRYFSVVLVALLVYLCLCPLGLCEETPLKTGSFVQYIEKLYTKLGLSENTLSFEAFKFSLTAYYIALGKGLIKKPWLLTIIDYTKPSYKERFFVIDLYKQKVLFKELVAHGKRSGKKYARFFSNQPGSFKSSIGLYVTLKTYTGRHGCSLRLKGLEKGFNDNAQRRHIVIHGAWYVNSKMARYLHWVGTSWGCPALPLSRVEKVIATIKDGSALYIYHPLKKYVQASSYLNLQKAALIFDQRIVKKMAFRAPQK